MEQFWKACAEHHRREQAAAKEAQDKAAAEERAVKEKAAKEAQPPHGQALAPMTPVQAPPLPTQAPPPRKKRRVKIRRRTMSTSSSDSMDDGEIVALGKHVSRIRDMNKAYPLLSRRHQAGIRRGVRKLADGDFDEQLTSKERKSIAQKRNRYKKVAKGGRNPFAKKNRKVGDTYRKFMSEVSFKKVDTSSNDSDSSSSSENTE